MWRNTQQNYGSVAKFLHWTIFLFVLIMLIVGFLLSSIPKPLQPTVYNTHKLIGLTILGLMIIRLLWALTNPKPALPEETLPWQRSAERIVHFLLYVALITMPLAGWIGTSAAGKAPHLGSLVLALPIAKNKPLAETAFFMHGLLSLIIITLVVIHVSAALYHHFIKRDFVLRRMWFGRTTPIAPK